MNLVLTGVSRFAESVTASRSRGAILLLAVCLLLFFLNLGRVPFYDRGESREGLVVWEMFTSGNWTLPIVNDAYIPFKPPLFHWTALLVAKILGGVDEFTLRFPSAFFGTLGVLLKAKETGLLPAVALVLDRLEHLRFRVDPETRQAVLRLAGEA